jgi:predicted acylesterase/phospholipase RssA
MTALSRPLALCFAGSGCLAAYQLGVARCMQRHGQPLLSRVTHVVGCSGGALVAATLARAPEQTDLAIEHSLLCRNMSGLEAALAAAAAAASSGYTDVHLQRDGLPVLVVATATAAAPRRLRMFSDWESTSELLTCLRASCHIPGDFHPLDALSPFASSYKSAVDYRGELLIDGGATPAFVSNSFSVCPEPVLAAWVA